MVALFLSPPCLGWQPGFQKGAAGAPFPHFGHAQSIRESPRDSKSPSRPCRTRSRATRPGGGGAVRHGRQL